MNPVPPKPKASPYQKLVIFTEHRDTLTYLQGRIATLLGRPQPAVMIHGGKARLLRPTELPADWDPLTGPRLTAWEVVHHLIRALETGGESAAAALIAKLGSRAEIARELAYRLYTVAERKKRAAEAMAYNGLVQSWTEIMRLARDAGGQGPAQGMLL